MLNPQQAAAVRLFDRPSLVLAGAGSGKTRVITHKIAHLIGAGVSARRITAVTFTNKAAREMRGRLGGLLKSRAQGAAGLTICTFHSLGLAILRREAAAAGFKPGFSVLDADDSMKVFKELAPHEAAAELAHYRWQVSAWKNDGLSPTDARRDTQAQAQAAAALYQAYQRQLAAYNAVDFDDLILRPLELLRGRADILRRWRERITHLLVDEYQDTNQTQYELLRLLQQGRAGLTVVGDDDQSIYAWRGARPENLQKLREDFPDLVVIKLEQNYRSTNRILSCANRLIAHNPHVYEKKLWSALRDGEGEGEGDGQGELIRVRPCADAEREAQSVVSDILTQRFAGSAKLGDVAILYRGNHQSRPLEQTLRAHRLPYRISGGRSFFDRAEVKDALAYLRLVANPADDPAFLRVINTPRRHIGAATLEKLGGYAGARGASLLTASREFGLRAVLEAPARARLQTFADLIAEAEQRARREAPHTLAQALLDEVDYTAWLREHAPNATAAERRSENVTELVAWIKSMHARDGADLADIVAKLALLDRLDKNDADSGEMINLMTLHAAKGLEFSHVYLVGFEEGLLPHHDTDDIEEERRLAYVGITRARRFLTLSYAARRGKHGKTQVREPSRFLAELPPEALRYADAPSPSARRETGRANIANLRALLAGR